MRNRLRPWMLLMVLALVAAACTGGTGTATTTPAEPATTTAPDTTSAPATETTAAAAPDTTAAPATETTVAPSAAPASFDRATTLYTGGKQWGPPANWNPVWPDYVTGTLGLLYETLFLFNPLNDEYIPWLAESGDWTSDTEYQVTLRDGVTWSDGEPLTSEDVVTTFELLEYPSTRFSGMWESNGGSLVGVEAVDDLTVTFTFQDPLYQQWGERLYDVPILPAHIWADRTEEEVAAGANENPVGSGAYLYESHDQTRMVWVKNPDWWGQEVLDLEVAPERVVDLVNISNNVALGQVLQGDIDLNNNFLPGISTLVEGGYGLSTYYPEPPYMIPANTAWLVLNTTKPPMDDPAFRKALANSVDVSRIVNGPYGNMVEPANPTGLLPVWDEYIDQQVVDELGFSYDPDLARDMLADAGYADGDGDGFVEMPDGSPIELTLIVPNGWTDWMESIRVVSEGAQAVGINVVPEFPDFTALLDARNSGNFDMVINNDRQMGSTPWAYYDYIFSLPIDEQQVSANFGRYENEEAWALVQELDRTPKEDVEAVQRISSELQRIHLTELPLIPLWYNGAWSQANTTAWTNWPSAEGENNYLPVTWNNYWNMTGVLMLTELEPVPAG